MKNIPSSFIFEGKRFDNLMLGLIIGIYGVIVYYNDASPEGALFNNEALPIMGVLLSLW